MMHRAAILALAALLGFPARAQWQSIGAVDSVAPPRNAECTVIGGGAVVQIHALAADLIRVRCLPPPANSSTQRLPAIRSYAVVKNEWAPVKTTSEVTSSAVTLRTSEIVVEIQKTPLRIRFLDTAGSPICEDHPSKGIAFTRRRPSGSVGQALGSQNNADDFSEVRVWKKMPEKEFYYGFGERAGRLMRKFTHMTNWNSDIPAYSADTDPLYQSIPFFYGIREGKAYGIFFDNTSWSSFDMGKEARDQYSFGAESGEIVYYFFYGPEPAKILRRYTELVGRMPLPPLWSLGYQQCRWSYTPESRVREIARGFRDRDIPCDVLYLDIDYMDGYRVFTWHPTNFPQPGRLVADLARDGFKTAVIIDPGIKLDSAYDAFRTGLAGNHFLTYADGSLFTGDVWPGRCAFPDFTSSGARQWWGDQFAGLIRDGIKGFWNDMNEPSVFNTPTKTVDLSVLHNDEGLRTSHAQNHNIYGMQMTRATYEGVRRLNPRERPFVLTRASYAGGQRYSAAWTGDNVASWEHLRMAVAMCLNLSISGQPFVGSDIGGFIGYPSGELFARWLQVGVFTPLMRAHSEINEKNKEPWEYGETFTSINRETIALRYRLLPYLYTVMTEAADEGLPAMRPMIFDYPEDSRFWNEETQFLLGNNLLVAPVMWDGARRRNVALPQGTWHDFWTGQAFAGGKTISVDAPLQSIPCFAKAGSVIPTQRSMHYVGEMPVDTLTLNVFPAAQGAPRVSSLYQDDGVSFAYATGGYTRRACTVAATPGAATCDISPAKGSYVSPTHTLHFRFLHIPAVPVRVIVDGTVINPSNAERTSSASSWWTYTPSAMRIDLYTPHLPIARRIELSYEH